MRNLFDKVVFAAVAWAGLAGVALAAEGAGEAGGIPLAKIGWHVLNLLLLAGVLAWVLTRKIKVGDILKGRSAEVKKEIDDVNTLRKETQARFDDLETRLAGFEQRLGTMRQDAEAEAERERAVILARADKDAADVAKAAERTIRDETARARQALRRDAAALAVELAGKQVRERFKPDDQQRLVEDFFTAVGADNGKSDDTVELTDESEVPHGR